ncbi:next to BRCA1 gene 1 protein isoform X1 [Oncorhynchus tshawytscha]|uniref:PB1 domain-containing protein n=1 Tax=Oncorhynchus tshawytscha TaxID=74940 RepID=A0AAZ3PUP9_ONCTS|nr:next to BRCA1 gene 1 protein isoform X1 [Oncorhynchus tshawytscha]
MGLPVTIKVNFRGNVKRFVAPDLDKSEWESVEAWIKASFGISHFQVKYFDEDNEEVSINSQEEYEEGVKSAEKQGNQLHMNVYKAKQGQAGTGPGKTQEVKELKGELRPAPPYPSRVKTVDKGTQVTPERDAVVVKDNKVTKPEDKLPPAWFRSYMEKFKDEVVKEVVERMCSDFSGQCCTHKTPNCDGPLEALGAVGGVNIKGPKVNSSSTGPPAYSSLGYTPECSKCKRPATDGAYQCRVCPSCILCELCRHSHDPSHNLVRTKTPLSIPEHGMSGELRFPRRGDRTVRKAERQRLKAERRQLKAEVKEIKKKLRLEKRGLQWSGPASTSARSNVATTQAPAAAPAPGPAPDPQASSPEGPEVSYTTLVPTMAALFLDENLPDGTRREPGTKFIKYWKMKNSGIITWTSETKLKCMWGNLALALEENREVAVPLLQPGQVGVVSVAFIAPVMEGTYTSHWRLAHCGEQFGPRVWCSIVVAPSTSPHAKYPQNKYLEVEPGPVVVKVEGMSSNSSRDSGLAVSVDYCHRDYHFPSVDLLTAQDLLSCELLDINVVQELEKVPNNTPVDLTPCVSPLPHNGPLLEHPDTDQVENNTEMNRVNNLLGVNGENSDPPGHEEEDISGTQFVCETVIRSLALEEAPDHKPPRRHQPSYCKPKVFGAVASGPVFGYERKVFDTALRVTGPDLLMMGVMRDQGSPPGLPQITLSEETVTEVLLAPEVENVYMELYAMKEEDEEDNKGRKDVKDQKAEDKEDEKDDNYVEIEEEKEHDEEEEEEERADWDEVSSQISTLSSSSCEDYVIVLPDCFDTSRPLDESTHSSALSEPVTTAAVEQEAAPDSEPEELDRATPEGERQERGEAAPTVTETTIHSSVNQMLCASQTLDAVPLAPEVVPPPVSLLPPQALYTHRSEAVHVAEPTSQRASGPVEPCQPVVHLNVSSTTRPSGLASALETTNSRPCSSLRPRGQGGITEGLVKGVLSVAASAYKALFTGQSCSTQRGVDPASQDASMMAVLLEMGFRDQRFNQWLLMKHRHNLLHTVNELVAMADNTLLTGRSANQPGRYTTPDTQ